MVNFELMNHALPMLKDQIASLPDSPGVYRYYNKEGVLIYVGKAKSLKKRVSSYFTKQSQYNRKTEKLVSEIVNLEYTLANTEFDALLLENIVSSSYFKSYLVEVTTFQQILEEIYYNVCLGGSLFSNVCVWYFRCSTWNRGSAEHARRRE